MLTSALRSSNTVLPIKFTGFKVSRSNNHNLLQWTTANETGYDRYEVEHSSDGSSFAVIANLPHRQNITDYSYQHVTEEPGVHYYRIAGFDKRRRENVHFCSICTRFQPAIVPHCA